MSKFRCGWLIALIFVSLAIIDIPDARAWCRLQGTFQGWGASTATSIPVRLHSELHLQMKHVDGTLWTRAELESSVRRALARLNASTGADTPRLFLDTTTSASSCTWNDAMCNGSVFPETSCSINNTIHFVPDNCRQTQIRQGSTTTAFVVLIQADDTSMGSLRFEPFNGSGAIFEQAVLHEIGHALGSDHPFGCTFSGCTCGGTAWSTQCPSGAGDCAVMASNGQNQAGEYYILEDHIGFLDLYGIRTAPNEEWWESSNLASGISSLSVGNIDAHGYIAASSAVVGVPFSSVVIAGYGRLFSASPVAVRWDWTTLSLSTLGAPNLRQSAGPLGAAQSSSTSAVVTSAYRLTSDSRRWERQLVVSTRPVVGGSWGTASTTPASGAIDSTRTSGVSAAFDPRTGVFLSAYRSNLGSIILQGRGGSFSSAFDTGIKSAVTPAIACANLASSNCILVFSQPPRPVNSVNTTRLQWVEFTWNQSTSSWSAGSVTTETTVVDGALQAAAYVSSSPEFVVSIQRSGTGTFPLQSSSLFHKVPGAASFTSFGAIPSTFFQVDFTAVGSTGNLEVLLFRHP